MAPTETARLITARCAFMREVCVHGSDVDLRHDDGGANAAFRAGGTEQISPGEAAVLVRAWARSSAGPDAGQRALLANSGLVLKPDLERTVQGLFRRECRAEQGGKVLPDYAPASANLRSR
jgi:hypothetical protein